MSPAVAVWFRRDLRVHDHGALLAAAGQGPVFCVYCVDPRESGATRELGLPRLGAFRARFLIEALTDLRKTLRGLGGELIVRFGRPEDVLPALAREHDWARLHCHALAGTEEADVEAAVTERLQDAHCPVHLHDGSTLVDPAELPFKVGEVPEVFTAFRKSVERRGCLASPLPPVVELESPRGVEAGRLPSLAELGVDEVQADDRAVLRFVGGESAGRARVMEWMWGKDRLRLYKQSRNGMVGADYSTKFSPWLALGCLSARWVQAQVARYESERVRNDSTYWLTFELLWRDFFHFVAEKHGARLYRAPGLQGIAVPWLRDERAFDQWRTGRTGIPIVDANMRELLRTGFMSNRGRQIVGSFLTKNLGIDWRWGAEWFESQLIDYEVAANWGNWCYVAGVGNDARGFRYFDVATQAAKYDRLGEYVKLWCPELALLGKNVVHSPWLMSESERRLLGVRYPDPVVDLDRSVERNRRSWEAAVGR